MKEFAPRWSKFFPYRVDSFSEGGWCARKQRGNHKDCLPCENENTFTRVSIHINAIYTIL